MCDDVIVSRGGVETLARTKGELRAALGIEPVEILPSVGAAWRDAQCLCPCDLAATARAAGMTLARDGYFDWQMTAS